MLLFSAWQKQCCDYEPQAWRMSSFVTHVEKGPQLVLWYHNVAFLNLILLVPFVDAPTWKGPWNLQELSLTWTGFVFNNARNNSIVEPSPPRRPDLDSHPMGQNQDGTTNRASAGKSQPKRWLTVEKTGTFVTVIEVLPLFWHVAFTPPHIFKAYCDGLAQCLKRAYFRWLWQQTCRVGRKAK